MLNNVKNLGHELLELKEIQEWHSNENSPIKGLVNIGPDLYQIIQEHNVPKSKIQVQSQIGDCFSKSWGFNRSSLVISSPNSSLCIRLAYDYRRNAYHILGFSGSIK